MLAKNSIEYTGAVNHVSIVSLWEIAIKISLKKLQLNTEFDKVAEFISDNDFKILPISFQDTLLLSKLFFYHRDPFDRLIISQCINNKFILISKDHYFKAYDVEILW